MKITDILHADSIIGELISRDKKGVLEELVSVLVEHGRLTNKEKPVQVLLERERLGSTGIGDGIAIPHGRLKEIKNIICSFGRTREGIDFQSIDEKPSHLFFLLFAPEESAGEHLQALARLSRILKDGRLRKRLMEAASEKEIYRLIAEEDEHYELP
ncbi:MAG: PTS fructose transporter subunit IIA [Deltaproteobacteria bacterium RBG_16_54_11]|jgi:PTS system nitrogen regulatory IIA component|nr:MAG: PTS fructose transporter subunit IIA [Deltaproteobacteria bacterium RBG_16_54_11]